MENEPVQLWLPFEEKGLVEVIKFAVATSEMIQAIRSMGTVMRSFLPEVSNQLRLPFEGTS